jgi:hypothetical protein
MYLVLVLNLIILLMHVTATFRRIRLAEEYKNKIGGKRILGTGGRQ